MRRWIALALALPAVVFAVPRPAAADLDCSDFASHADAQSYFESRGGSAFNNVDGLDRDHDGVACELGPGSGYSGSSGGYTTTEEEARDAYIDYQDSKYDQYDQYDDYDPGDGEAVGPDYEFIFKIIGVLLVVGWILGAVYVVLRAVGKLFGAVDGPIIPPGTKR